MTKVILNKKISSRVANGHPWIYGNEVNNVVGEPARTHRPVVAVLRTAQGAGAHRESAQPAGQTG